MSIPNLVPRHRRRRQRHLRRYSAGGLSAHDSVDDGSRVAHRLTPPTSSTSSISPIDRDSPKSGGSPPGSRTRTASSPPQLDWMPSLPTTFRMPTRHQVGGRPMSSRSQSLRRSGPSSGPMTISGRRMLTSWTVPQTSMSARSPPIQRIGLSDGDRVRILDFIGRGKHVACRSPRIPYRPDGGPDATGKLPWFEIDLTDGAPVEDHVQALVQELSPLGRVSGSRRQPDCAIGGRFDPSIRLPFLGSEVGSKR